jgi:hypothetical protein
MSEVIATGTMERFLDAARGLFDVMEDGRGGRNEQYIDVEVRVSEGHLPGGGRNPLSNRHDVVANPVVFVTGLRTRRIEGRRQQPLAASPSITLIVGQYGLGKTELVFQICNQMADSIETALPINLALSRDRVGLLAEQQPTPEKMADLLFGRIMARAGLGPSFAFDELLPAIRNGEIVLLLDGLDELISTPTQHHAFFTGLTGLLNRRGDSAKEPQYKVVITMRFEYLAGVADNAVDLVGRQRIPVYYLVLDYLDETQIPSYLEVRLETRLPQWRSLFEEIQAHKFLLDMFRRPLLLRIFCDLVLLPDFKPETLMRNIRDKASPKVLLEAFIEAASRDAKLLKEQDRLSSKVVWDADLLSERSLDLYRNGETELSIADLRKVIVPLGDGLSLEEARNLPPVEILKGLHKCPFIRHHTIDVEDETKPIARFAHRIFYEYFTSRGMAAEITDPRPGMRDKKRAFDELVLNVDMRKFLRGLLDSDDIWHNEAKRAHGLVDPDNIWHNETKRAYGLVDPEDLEEWHAQGMTDLDELNERRWTLLQYMTDPEHPPLRARETVEWFLERQSRWLHPRYLIYNYEAVTVFLWYERRNSETEALRSRFGEILRKRFEMVLDELKAAPAEVSERTRARKLLLERLLDIGRRLRYAWARDYGEPAAEDRLMEFLGAMDGDIKKRIQRIIEDIRVTVF